MNPDTSENDTVELVSLAQLHNLARLGVAMRKAQQRWLSDQPGDDDARRFDRACASAIAAKSELVPLLDLLRLARLGMAARRELKPPRGIPVTGEYQAAVIAQRRFSAACAAALDREQQSLPGMGGGEGGGPA